MRRTLLPILALAILLATAATANAAPGDPWQFKYFFDTAGLPNGFSAPGDVAVNTANGNVLVQDQNQGTITQFDANGEPLNFSALGTPQISVSGGGNLAINNTGGPAQGRIYFFSGENAFVWAPDGTPFGEGFGGPGWYWPAPEERGPFFNDCGGGLDPAGGVWFASQWGVAAKLTPEMEKTGTVIELDTSVTHPYENSCPIEFDSHGDAYMPMTGPPGVNIRKLDGTTFDILGSTGIGSEITNFQRLQVDPATDDLYVGVRKQILAVHRTEPVEPTTPFTAIDGVQRIDLSGFEFDATGQTLYVAEQPSTGGRVAVFHREPASAPRDLGPVQKEEIRSRGAVLRSSLISGGAQTSYFFEYGTDTSYGFKSETLTLPYSHYMVPLRSDLVGLEPSTTYHLRLVAVNAAGTTYGPDTTLTTYPTPAGGGDPCPNALARKQTGARPLPDCRAYELVSAADTGGYDVESYLAPGQSPFPGFPEANDRVLYATHSGAIPGPWNATNRGPDPYLASRGAGGWRTTYLGLPADINSAAGAFSSVLGEASPGLDALAFAGAGLCDPCFGSGLATGIPVRLANGQILQGMAGSLDGSVPASALPEGRIGKYFSADGRYLVFASKYAFEPGANGNGDLTVYERDLATGTTRIVSTDPSGATLTGAGISELDLSADGSRVLVGTRVATDPDGNEYVHPYLHLAGAAGSVDLAPGSTSGVLFGGMTTDGSRVFFTTVDALLPGDTDSSADLYAAEVSPGGALDLQRITPGGSDACDPVANSGGPHWNSTAAGASCDAVAIGGGGGVASGSGDVYFLSPEQLDGTAGTADQPNLYLAEPGAAPRFVATLEPDNPLVLHSVHAASDRHTGDFETTPGGGYAVFRSSLHFDGAETHGFLNVFRYDAAADGLACGSCDVSGTSETVFDVDAELAPDGRSLLDDGRVFFTTRAPLVLNDANGRGDVYEWSQGRPQLISGGGGPFDSGLLTASADGTDVFFFTHDALAPEEDSPGGLMRIYDAREGGGFFHLPPDVPCAASDECHGPGTVIPPPPAIRSSGVTTDGNVLVCPKKKVKRHGKCVKRKKHRRKHGKKRHGKHAGAKGKRGGRNA